ncbi:RadC family protein [Streptococcus cuniculipharyngis]|uniref:JAB domain-containing protein n=1 Tax=Streptococcus cuniculipharyngis TaxID=1562651 RepID=A0A5C5SD85_9STRE|nr:DNA repair protein RadC [Streptococcus cuniculipharyngis]TWS98926.1 JAB domain-containing protein [Streptococcus cuniculipharyngis]
MYAVKLAEEAMKPRERLLALGAEQLSHQELLAIILRTGNKKLSVMDIANQIIAGLANLADLRELSIQELQQLSGIGQVKAIEIKAMLELSKRIHQSEYIKQERVLSSERVAKKMMLALGDKKQEHLVALYLDTQNRIIKEKVIFIGGVRRSIAEPREILYHACKTMATSLIVVHNHPSGVPFPSDNDIDFTKKIKRSCQDLGVLFLDHIIVGKHDYYSFREENTVFKDD